jgi:radical SAM-linked protein
MREISTVKYHATFSKKGDIVYISHLDLMSVFRRALRRSGLPFVLTKGFTPRVKISIPMALKLGKESDREEMSLWLTETVGPAEVTEKINRELPEGIRVEELRPDSGR